MTVSGTGDTPLIPKDKTSHTKLHKEKSSETKVDTLKTKITQEENSPLPQRTVKSTRITKKSIKEDPVKNGTFEESVPADISKLILSHLSQKDLNQASLVNKQWAGIAPSVALNREFLLLKSFVEHLAANLDEKHRTKLHDLFSTSKIYQSKNLTALRSGLIDLREKIVILIKDLDTKKLQAALAPVEKPLFFDKISNLVRIYNEIDQTTHNKWQFAVYIFQSLCQLGCFEKSIQLANTIEYESQKRQAFLVIFRELIKSSKFKDLKLVKPINDPETLLKISDKLAETGQFNKALELAKIIPDFTKRQKALEKIAIEAGKKQEFTLAINVALSITTGKVRENTLLSITKELCYAKKFDQATTLAYFININDEIRAKALHEIDMQMAQTSEGDETPQHKSSHA